MTVHDPDDLAAVRSGTPLLHDEFRSGLQCTGPSADWQLRPAAGREQGDGVAVPGGAGLEIAPPGRDPETGEPRFAEPAREPAHVRWAALVRRESSAGFPGFDALPGGRLTLEAELSVRAFGLRRLAASADADDDPGLALACAALITTDRETGLVFDFMLTDRRVYAVYERLGPPDGPNPAFTYTVPVAARVPESFHRCVIAYHRDSGTVDWFLDDSRVLTVDRIGERLPGDVRATRDNGRPAGLERPRQLTAGLGLFAERTLGQGARLTVRRVSVHRG
jgi:hypothetical protein